MDFFLGITNKCNLSCPWCAHKRLRNRNLSYEMTKEEFDKWYLYTKEADYHFDSICINGFGEPTCFSDIKLLKYILVKCRSFTNNVNLLTNGTNIPILKEILPFIDNVQISVWDDNISYHHLQNEFPHKIHLNTNIRCHDVSTPFTEHTSTKISICGCHGIGYSMGIVFLVCGTWCPEIRMDDIHHTRLKENYLSTLDDKLGTTSFDMCYKCHANTSIPYKLYGENEWKYDMIQ